jgi:hypothetical protein
MRTFLAAVLVATLSQSSIGLAQSQPSNYSRAYRAPQGQAPVARAPIMRAPVIHAPVVRAPASSQVRSGIAPGGTYIRPGAPVTVGAPIPQQRLIQAGPRIIRVPSVSTLPDMVHRPIARRVVVHGAFLAVPAIVIVGAPFVLDVPDLGWVYVPENEYAEIYDLLTSDNPDDVELGYLRLQELAGR